MSVQFDFSKIEASINRVTTALTALDKNLVDASKSGNTFVKAFGNQADFDKFVTSLDKLNTNSAKSFRAISAGLVDLGKAIKTIPAVSDIQQIGNVLGIFFNQIDTIAANTKHEDSIKTLSNAASRIQGLLKTLSESDVSQFNTKTLEQKQLLASAAQEALVKSSLKGGFNSLKQFGTQAYKANTLMGGANATLGLVGRSVSGFTNFFKTYGDNLASVRNPTAGEKKLKDIAQFFSVFGDISKQISGIAGRTQNIGSLDKLSQSFLNITNAMDNLSQLSNKIPHDLKARLNLFLGLGDLGGIIKIIGGVARALGNLAGSVPNLTELGNLGNALKNVANGIRIIYNLSSQIPHGIGDRLKLFLGLGPLGGTIKIIGQVSKQLAGVANSIKDVQGFDKFGNALEGIGNFIRAINKTNIADIRGSAIQRIPLIGKIFGQTKFKQVVGVIKDIASAFKGFKGVAIPDLGTVLPGIIEFATNVGNVDFTKINLKGFSSFTLELGKGLKNLSGVNVDAKKLAAIGGALGGLSSKISVQTNAALGQSGSVLENAAGQFIGQVAFSVLEKVQGFIGKLLNFSSLIRDALQSVGASVTQFGNSLQQAGQSLLTGFGLGALANSPIAQVAADFDHLSNAVQVFGHLTDTELASAQAFANELGQKYPLSANDALKATLDLIKAGQSLNTIHFVLPAAADLAALGDTDLPNTTKALIQATNTFNTFQKGVSGGYENIAAAANSFSAAADGSTATVQDLIDGLGNVGPAANLAGLDLQQTLAVLSQFNDAGIRGAEAGTQLSQVLAGIHKPAAENELAAIQLLLKKSGSDINLSLSNADGSLRNFNDVIDSLSKAYKTLGFSQSDLLDSLSKIGGVRAKQGLAVLIGKGGFQGVIDAMNGMDTASVRAGQLLNDFQGDVHQLQGSLETLEKNGFLPIIRNAFRPFVQLARSFVDSLLGLSPAFYELAGNIILTASSLATLVGGVAIAIGVVAKFEGSLFSLASGFIELITNLPALIVGIGGFVAALGTIIVVATSLAVVIGGVALVFSGFKDVIERNIGNAGGAFDQFRSSVEYTMNRVGAALGQVGRLISLIFGNTAQGEVDNFGKRVADFFNRLTIGSFKVDQVVEQIGALAENFGNFIEASFGTSSTQKLNFFEDQLKKLATFPLIKALFGQNISASGLKRIFGDTQKFFSNLTKSVDEIASGLIGVLFGEPKALDKAKAGVASLFSLVTKSIIEPLTHLDLTNSILDFDQGKIGAGITDFFKVVLSKIRDWFVSNRDKIVQTVGDVLSFGVRAVFGAGTFILKVLGLDSLANVVQTVGNSINDIIHGAVQLAIRLFAGESIVDTSGIDKFIKGFLGDPQSVTDTLARNLAGVITGAIGKIPQLLTDIGTKLNIQALIDLGNTLGASTAFTQIATALGNIASYPLKAIGDVFDGVKSIFDAAASGNTSGVIAVLTALGVVAASSGALGLIFSGLKSVLLGAVIPAVGIVTLVSALGNLNDLLKTGDVGTFLKNTLVDIAQALASFVGIDLGGRQNIIDRVGEALTAASQTLPALFTAIGDKISSALDGIFKDILSRITIFIDSAKVSLGIGGGDFGQAFKNAQAAVAAPTNDANALGQPANVFTALSDPALSPSDSEAIARTSSDRIIAAFDQIINFSPDGSKIPQALFDSIAKVLNNAGLVDAALNTVDPGPTKDALFKKIQDSINSAAPIPVTIKIDPTLSATDASNAIVAMLQSGQITTGQASQIRDNYISAHQNIPGRAGGGNLQPYSAYEVHDTKSPELARFSNGLSLLLTGASGGSIQRIVSMAGAPALVSGGSSGLAISPSDILAARAQIKKDNKSATKTDTLEKQLDKIGEAAAKAELDSFQKIYRIDRDFQDNELKAEAQFEHDRANIISDSHETLLDAIRRGDGAAALSASRNAHKQLDEQAYQFKIADDERRKTLQDNLNDAATERKQKEDDFAQQIQDAKDQDAANLQAQQDSNSELADDQSQSDTETLNSQKAANTELKTDAKSTTTTITDQYAKNNAAILDTGNAFSAFIQNAQLLVNGLNNHGVIAFNSTTGAQVPTLPQSTGNTGGSIGPHIAPAGAPAHPYTLQTYTDPTGKLWLWNGSYWQSASSTPGHASSGSFGAHSAFRVHDTDRTELMTMSNGQSLVLSGKNSGSVMPVQNHSGNGGSTHISVSFGDIISQSDNPVAVGQEVVRQVMPKIREYIDNAGAGKRSNSPLGLRS